jgi:hypothetical protein
VRYIDPTGHGTECGFGESCVVDPYTNPILSIKKVNNNGGSAGTSSSSSDESGSAGNRGNNTETVHMGGTIPAEIPGFSTQDQEYLGTGSPGQVFDVFGELFYYQKAFTAHKKPPALNVYLTYALTQGEIHNLSITVVNAGASSGTLNFIEIDAKPLPSINSCIQGEPCTFIPRKTVSFDPKNISTLHICTECLSDNINIYSMPKPIDVKGSYQSSVMVSITVHYDFGRTVARQSIPFVYNFPYP